MRKRCAFLMLFLLVIIQYNAMAQSFNTSISDPVRNRAILVDLIDREGLLTGEIGAFFQTDYEVYKPDEQTIASLQPLIEGLSITIVLGTWCGDSKEQLPRFIKILDLLNYPDNELLMIGVDSYKIARQFDVEIFEIEKVPTFIFSKGGIEIGRIIETPVETLEADMLNILK